MRLDVYEGDSNWADIENWAALDVTGLGDWQFKALTEALARNRTNGVVVLGFDGFEPGGKDVILLGGDWMMDGLLEFQSLVECETLTCCDVHVYQRNAWGEWEDWAESIEKIERVRAEHPDYFGDDEDL